MERDNHHDNPATQFANHDHLASPVFVNYDHLLELSLDELKTMAKDSAQKPHAVRREPENAVRATSLGSETKKLSADEAARAPSSGFDTDVMKKEAHSRSAQQSQHDGAKDAAQSPRSATTHDTRSQEDAPSPPIAWPGRRSFHEDQGPYERHHLREKAWAKHLAECCPTAPESFHMQLISPNAGCKVMRGFSVKQSDSDQPELEDAYTWSSSRRSSSESASKRVDSALMPSSVEDGVENLECAFTKSQKSLVTTDIAHHPENPLSYQKIQGLQQRNRRDSSLTLALRQPNLAAAKPASHLHAARNNYQDLTAMARRQAQPAYQVTFAEDGDADNAIASDSEYDENDDASVISVVGENWPITQASIDAVEKESSYLEMAPRPCRRIPNKENQEMKKCKSVTWADTPRPEPFHSHTEITNTAPHPQRPSTIPAYSHKQAPRSQPRHVLAAPESKLPRFLSRTESWQWNYVANAHGHSRSELPPPWFTMPQASSARAISLHAGTCAHTDWV